jgi:NifU-like protein involved in Fe-S cluster formation
MWYGLQKSTACRFNLLNNGVNMKLKLLSAFVVIAFSLGACGEGTASSSTVVEAVAGVSVPSKVEVIPDN